MPYEELPVVRKRFDVPSSTRQVRLLLTYLSVSDKPIADWNYLIKRVEDQVLASILLLPLLPLLGAIAVAIKLDSPGPALFRQKRYGFNNELFDVFKFRTMYHRRTASRHRNSASIGPCGSWLSRQ